jgi:hypothetical protein
MSVAGNVQPQFTRAGNVVPVKFGGTALTTSDGSGGTVGTSMILLFTPGANDSYVDAVRCIPVASSAGATYSATCIRVYISTVNTGSTTAANTNCIGELPVASSTAANSTSAVNWYDIPLAYRIGGSNASTPVYLLISSHVVNASNTNWTAIPFAADY